MPTFETGDLRLSYSDIGSGFPLLYIPGGGLNSCVVDPHAVFDVAGEVGAGYRFITMDLRNANLGHSSGPLDMAAPWDSFTADHLALLDHLGIDRFMVIGFCVGNQLIWNLLKHAPERVIAAVAAQPAFFRTGESWRAADWQRENWMPKFLASRPDIAAAEAEAFIRKVYDDVEFIGTVTRDFVRTCQTPLLVLPDDVWAHPYDLAMEMVHLAPNAQVSLFPWKNNSENMALAIRHIRTFLKANQPVK